MNYSLRTTLPVIALTLLCAASVGAQTVQAPAEPPPPRHHIVRADIALEMVNRTFELEGPSEVLFDAPYYPGLRIGLSLFPVALANDTSPAAGLGFRFETSKHTVNTVAAYEIGDETYDFDVPTRHDVTHLELMFEWRAARNLVVTPAIAWHTVEFALGYNPLYRDSFYRGIEVGAGADYELKVEGLSLGARVAVRPSVDLGSTVEPYGTTASSFGIAVSGGMRYVSRLGLFAEAEVSFDRYATTYRPDRNEDRDDSTATDRFRGFVFALGYAY